MAQFRARTETYIIRECIDKYLLFEESENPYIFLQVYDQETGVWTSGAKNTTATSAGTTYIFSGKSFSTLSVGVQVIAIGKWK